MAKLVSERDERLLAQGVSAAPCATAAPMPSIVQTCTDAQYWQACELQRKEIRDLFAGEARAYRRMRDAIPADDARRAGNRLFAALMAKRSLREALHTTSCDVGAGPGFAYALSLVIAAAA